MCCSGLHRVANHAFLGGFLCSGLQCVAPYCAPGGVRVVSGGSGWSLAATAILGALELRASYSNVTDAQRSAPRHRAHLPDPKRVASRSASRAPEESIPATCNRSMAVERTWETSALVSRSLLLRSTDVASPAAPSAKFRVSSGELWECSR